MRHLVVINPRSFKGESQIDFTARDFRAYFDSVPDLTYHIHVSRYPRDGIRTVRNYITAADSPVRVYSVGGDGILFDCLNGLAGLPGAELAVVPYGTSNDFVRSFGEDNQSVFRNVSKQATAGTIPTDAIRIRNKYALNFCCVGGEAAVVLKSYEIARNHPHFAKLLGKQIFTAGIPAAVMDKGIVNQKYELIIDSVPFPNDLIGINIGNGTCYGGNKIPFPMADPTDGYIDVMAMQGKVKWQLAKAIYDYTAGKYYKHPQYFKHTRAKEVIVRSDSPLSVNADGETYYDSEVAVSVVPQFVKIVTPDNLKYCIRQKMHKGYDNE